MNKTLLAMLALALLAPTASAHHWTDDRPTPAIGDSGDCDFTAPVPCAIEYACLGGSPPQIVDTGLHCANRLASEAPPIAESAADWVYALVEDLAEVAENQPAAVNQATAGERGEINDVLCNVVWSLFCSVPIALPEHVPIDDPLL